MSESRPESDRVLHNEQLTAIVINGPSQVREIDSE
jgi:hypothetical protein